MPDAASPPRADRGCRGADAVAIALLAAAVSAVGADRPSLWFDEAATVSAAHDRPLSSLAAMLGHIDAVHGLHYLLMHGWLLLVAPTEWTLRAPSVVAVAGAAAGTVVLGGRLAGRSVGVTAGLVFAVLPRVTWAGIEARSYAVAMLAAVWLTVVVVAALRRQRGWLWALYPPLLATAVLLNLFLLLLVPVYLWAAAVLRAKRAAVIWLAVLSAATVAALWPFVALTRTQVGQVHWITAPAFKTVGEVAVRQYFDTSVALAWTVGALLVAAAAVTVRRWRWPSATATGAGVAALLAAGWLAIPTTVAVVASTVGDPIYYPRYLAFTAPAAALLLGVAVVTVARSPRRVGVLLTTLAVLAAPGWWFSQRSAYAKEQMDYSAVADVVAAHAAPRDCLLLDNTANWLPGPIRPLTAARPDVFDSLVDPGRGRTAVARGTLWDGHIAVWKVARALARCPRIWLVTEHDPTLPAHSAGVSLPPGPRLAAAPAYVEMRREGFRVVARWQFSFAAVVLLAR